MNKINFKKLLIDPHNIKQYNSFLLPILFFLTTFFFPETVRAIGISNIVPTSTSIRDYEKYELHFNVSTVSTNQFFQYDDNPPPGVQPKTGISVEAIFTSPSGKQLRQPAFYMTQVSRSTDNPPVFTETNKKYWVIRFSPQEIGNYQVNLTAKDSSGTATANAGSFTALAPVKPGFIKVSSTDSRYFEFSNGSLYWPIGPANGNDFSKFTDSGLNFARPWMAGSGAYSTNWSRWISSAEDMGNEGYMTRLTWKEHAPGHELSYEMFYPAGFHLWITNWNNSSFAQHLKPNTKYQVHFVAKTANLNGPRVSGYPYGLVVKLHCGGSYDWPTNMKDPTATDDQYRNCPQIVPHILANRDWFTIDNQFTTSSSTYNDISIYLDNVTQGQSYIDEFSLKEVLADGSLGGELIRAYKADLHTYVDDRAASYFDWQLEQGEKYGIYFKYVVHDKNDWIQNHLLSSGQWSDFPGDGYYQAENTKAGWLLRQWYRYLTARYGYSTAVHSWELNNEGPPNEDPIGSGTSPHWRTAQSFAQFMHQNDAQPHMATTSFWCCWRPTFWGNKTVFPDIDYADLHEYSSNTENSELKPLIYDLAEWTNQRSLLVGADKVGKPVIRGETGITDTNGTALPALSQANPGIWYHNLLWAGLNSGGMSDPNYWYSEHLNQINQLQISAAFAKYMKDVDINKGGYSDIKATADNAKLRVYGQKNVNSGIVYGWIQNSDHTWKKYSDGIRSSQSGTVSFSLSPNKAYNVQWWNTGTGVVSGSQTVNSNNNGILTLQVNSLADDTAFKINYQESGGGGSTPTPILKPGDANGDSHVDGIDYTIWLGHYRPGAVQTGGNTVADFNNDKYVDGVDYTIWLSGYGK